MPEIPASPLAELHRQADAEMQAYDQVEIVSTFGEPQAEYAAIRKAAAIMDLPQRGVIELTGKDRHAFLNNLITNQTFDKTTKSPSAAGKWAYAFLLNLKGRVVADMNLIELPDRTLLEVDARLAPMLASLFERYLFAEVVKIKSLVGELAEIAVHGLLAAKVLADEGLSTSLQQNDCAVVSLIGAPAVAWRDDICGVPGFHLLLPRERTADVWQHLLTRHGAEISLGKRTLRAVGWAAFNATRIEAGRPLFGIDFELAPPSMPGKKANPDEPEEARPVGVLPAETSLFDRAVSVTKGCYLGQEVVARMHARQQVARQLVGVRIADEALPLAGAHVMNAEKQLVGTITSSTMSPILSDAAIAFAFVRKPNFELGRKVYVQAEEAVREATVVSLPFVAGSSS